MVRVFTPSFMQQFNINLQLRQVVRPQWPSSHNRRDECLSVAAEDHGWWTDVEGDLYVSTMSREGACFELAQRA